MKQQRIIPVPQKIVAHELLKAMLSQGQQPREMLRRFNQSVVARLRSKAS